MSVSDLVFTVVASGETVYDPLQVGASYVNIQVTNYGEEDLSGLGLYLVATTNLGDVDNPADYPPHTDYQDILTWGQATALGLEATGGLKINAPQNIGTFEGYVTRTQGALKGNKIPFADIPVGGTESFSVLMETPPGVSSRRFFIDLVLE